MTARRPSAAAALVVVVALAVLVVLTAQVLTGGVLTEVDGAVRDAVLAHHVRWLDGLLQALSDVAGSAVEAPALAVLAVALSITRRSWYPLLLAGVSLVALGALVLLGKAVIGRAGPDRGPDVLHVGGAAFPSGHAAIAVLAPAIAVVLLVRPAARRPWYWAVSGFALLVGAARVYVQEHWCTDVVAGWSLGVILLVSVLAVAGSRVTTGTFGPRVEDFRHPIADRGHR